MSSTSPTTDMKRKLITQGGGGYTIYLPKEWVDERSLGAGDVVDVEATDSALIIRASGKSSIAAKTSIVGDSTQFTRMKIMNLYRLGYDSIEVGYKSEREVRAVKETLGELLGFTIVRDVHTKHGGVLFIESISEPNMDSYETIASRMMHLFEELLGCIAKRDTSSVEALAAEAYRYDHFCKRVISKRMFQKHHIALYWAFHLQLIHSIREAQFLNEELKKAPLQEGTKKLIETAQELFSHVKRAYFSRDTGALLPMYDQREVIMARAQKLFKTERALALHYTLSVIRNIHLTASPLFSIISGD